MISPCALSYTSRRLAPHALAENVNKMTLVLLAQYLTESEFLPDIVEEITRCDVVAKFASSVESIGFNRIAKHNQG